MKYLKIQNSGELDIRLVALMGGTTKSKDEFKIGQWGSGLKYTLAYLLKNNMDFKIFIGENEVKVTTEIETIRDEDFEIICINGKRTSITTQMGGQAWEPWMIVRELWCNALDEGGESKEVTESCNGSIGTTTFYIQLTSDIKKVWDNFSDYFIHGQEPLCETGTHKVFAGGNAMRLYKQGVLIYEDKHKTSLFSYDIKGADINELREFRGTPSLEMTRALAQANERVISYFFENITEKFYEGEMDYGWYCTFSQSWKTVIGKSKIIHKKAIETMNSRGIDFDVESLIVVPKNVYDFLTKEFVGIGALRMADKINEFYEIFDSEIDMKIKAGLATLEACGYFMHPELKFVYGIFGDKRIWAQVNKDTKEIMISECIKNKSHFDIVTTIIEENEHFNTGFMDKSREFQQHFIDLYAKTMLDKNNFPV